MRVEQTHTGTLPYTAKRQKTKIECVFICVSNCSRVKSVFTFPSGGLCAFSDGQRACHTAVLITQLVAAFRTVRIAPAVTRLEWRKDERKLKILV